MSGIILVFPIQPINFKIVGPINSPKLSHKQLIAKIHILTTTKKERE